MFYLPTLKGHCDESHDPKIMSLRLSVKNFWWKIFKNIDKNFEKILNVCFDFGWVSPWKILFLSCQKLETIFCCTKFFYDLIYWLVPKVHAANPPIERIFEKPCQYANIMLFKAFGKENAKINIEFFVLY